MAKAKKKLRGGIGTVSDINVTPMVDVMLVLLIIFMVITPMLQKGVSVDLARTKNPRNMQDADKEDALVVAITRDGNIFFGATTAELIRGGGEELSNKLKDALVNRVDRTVYVKADSRAKYSAVVTAVDDIRTAGVDTLGLLTEKIETSRGGVQQAASVQ